MNKTVEGRMNIAEGKLRTEIAKKQLQKGDVFTRMLNTSSDMVCIFNNEGYFVWTSKKWSKTLGWSREELCSVPFFEFIHPEDIQPTIDAFEDGKKPQKFRQRQSNYFVNRYKHKDGRYVKLEWNISNHPEDSYYHDIPQGDSIFYGFGVARPLHTKGDLELGILPTRIDTIFLDSRLPSEPIIVGTEPREIFKGMTCQDIAPVNPNLAIWKCVLQANVGKSMGFHRHPNQIEEIQVLRGILNLRIQRHTPLQLLGLRSKLELIWTKDVSLKEGDTIKLKNNRWHEVLKSPTGANYLVFWKPRIV